MTFIVTEVIRSLRSVMRSRLRFELLHFRGCLFHLIAGEMRRKRLLRKPAVQTSAPSGRAVLGQASRPDRNFRLGERSDCYREEAREPESGGRRRTLLSSRASTRRMQCTIPFRQLFTLSTGSSSACTYTDRACPESPTVSRGGSAPSTRSVPAGTRSDPRAQPAPGRRRRRQQDGQTRTLRYEAEPVPHLAAVA
jgi:hypothetical protein